MVAASVRPAIFDREITALAPAELAQPSNESVGRLALRRGRVGAQEPDRGAFAGVLCASGEWPSRRRPSEHGDELATPDHSITSSASNCIELGTSMPSALAACKLITNSNLVDCATGRSVGFSPLIIRPT